MKVTYKMKEIEINDNIKVEDLLKEKICKSKYQVVGCIFNNEYQNLSYEITEDGNLELIDISSKEGMKIYVRTFVYIMGKAFEKIYPDKKMTVEYQLGDAMFCTCDNMEITQEFMDNFDDYKSFLKGYKTVNDFDKNKLKWCLINGLMHFYLMNKEKNDQIYLNKLKDLIIKIK